MDQATEPPPPSSLSYDKRRLWYDERRLLTLVTGLVVSVVAVLASLVFVHVERLRAEIRASDAKIANDTLRLQLERRQLELGSVGRGNAGPSAPVAPIVVLPDPSIAAPKTSEERRAAAASWSPAIAALADLTNTFAAAGLSTAGKLRDLASTTVEELKKKGIDVGGNLFEHGGKIVIDRFKEHPKEDGNGATLPGQSSYSRGSVIVNCSTALMSRGARGQPEKDDPPGSLKLGGGVTVASADDCRCQQQTALSTSQDNAPGTQ
jgi:hypothetical protein